MTPRTSPVPPTPDGAPGPGAGIGCPEGWRLLLKTQTAWTLALVIVWGGGLFLLPVDPDYTGGELLDHLLSWLDSGTLYSDPSALPHRVLNYPPLFLALARGLAALGIPPLQAGRLLGSLGVLLALWVLYRWLRDLGVAPFWAAMGLGLVGSSFPLLYSFGQFHLEGFAVAATLGGFWLAARGGRWSLLAGLALATGCFFKQTQVVLSLVALLWIWRHRSGKELAMALGVFFAAGTLGSVLLTLAFGMEPWKHMLTYTVGTFSLRQLGLQQVSFVASWMGFLGAALWAMRQAGDRWRDPRSWYLLGSAVWTLSAVRQGSSYSYFLDLHLAVLLWVVPFLARPPGPILRRLLALQVLVGSGVVGGILGYNLMVARNTAGALPAICEALARADSIREHPGPAAKGGWRTGEPEAQEGYLVSGSPGLARACGRKPALHPFITASLARQGLWNPASFENTLAEGGFGRILLSFQPGGAMRVVDRERWTRETLSILRERYEVVGSWAGWHVLAPARR